MINPSSPKLYTDLASWWPLLSAPEDYAEEADFYYRLIQSNSSSPVATLLELGSGGGNNASHLKAHFKLTLVDLSDGMVEVSRALNPECEHIVGDMRTVRLGRLFDVVFIQDAISYMTTEEDLRQAIWTAYSHCRPGGLAIFHPDFVRENFRENSSIGGHDGGERSLRYIEWIWDPDPQDNMYRTDFAYLLRDSDGEVGCTYDRHEGGLFSHATWMRILEDCGFQARSVPFVHSELIASSGEVFLGLMPE